MLVQISIKNLVIIDDITIDFQPGFSVMCGETGAGKSIIIDAILLLTATRANSQLVGQSADTALIEGVFSLTDNLRDKLSDLNIQIDDDYLIITRSIDKSSKSTIKINNRIVTLSVVKEVMSCIIDIHQQHDSLSLFNKSNYLDILDSYFANELASVKKQYKSDYQNYCNVKKQLAELSENVLDENQLLLIQQQLAEIKQVHTSSQEYTLLKQRLHEISDFEYLNQGLSQILTLLDDNWLKKIHEVTTILKQKHFDSTYEEVRNELVEITYQLSDHLKFFSSKLNGLEFDQNSVDNINARLFEIEKLLRKYGNSFTNLEESTLRLSNLVANSQNYEYDLLKTKAEYENALVKLSISAKKLSEERQNLSVTLVNQIKQQFKDLYLENARFLIDFKQSEYNAQGSDSIDFLVKINAGGQFESLSKAISGGELSRLALALKVIMVESLHIQVAIFDEIDTGVSGRVATAMAQKMKQLSTKCQVIAISHLANVASVASHQLLIKKTQLNDKTKVSVSELNKEERIIEIAKMLSDGNATSKSLELAKELLNE